MPDSRRAGTPLVEVDHLTKIYEPSPRWMSVMLKSSIREPVLAVPRPVAEGVARASSSAVVGPNGAGKSTLFRVLTGLITPTVGTGRPWPASTSSATPGRPGAASASCPPTTAASTCATPAGRTWPSTGACRASVGPELRPAIDEALATVGLEHVHDRTGHALSSGMKARLQLARALLHEPDILILDEPTGTVDPIGAYDLLQLIQRLAAERQPGGAAQLAPARGDRRPGGQRPLHQPGRGGAHRLDGLAARGHGAAASCDCGSTAPPAPARRTTTWWRLRRPAGDRSTTPSCRGRQPQPRRRAPAPRASTWPAIEAVDRSRMPLQELISRLMRGGVPDPAHGVGDGAATAGRPRAPTDGLARLPASQTPCRPGARPGHAELAWRVVAAGPVRARRRPGERGEQRRRSRSERVGQRVRLAGQRDLRQRDLHERDQREREPALVSAAAAHLAPRSRRKLGLVAQARRAWQVTSAFTWLGYTEELALPAELRAKQAQPIFTVVVYYFLSLLVTRGPTWPPTTTRSSWSAPWSSACSTRGWARSRRPSRPRSTRAGSSRCWSSRSAGSSSPSAWPRGRS